MTGWAYQDLSLFAAQYDQDQWAHAFGMAWFAPYASDQARRGHRRERRQLVLGHQQGHDVLGRHAARCTSSTRASSSPVRSSHPTSFRDGQFAQPGSGGAFQDQVTTQGNKVGDLGLGYPEYSLLGPKDFALVWYDPKAGGPRQHPRQQADRQLLVPRRRQALHAADVDEGRAEVLHEAADRRRELHDLAGEGRPAASTRATAARARAVPRCPRARRRGQCFLG